MPRNPVISVAAVAGDSRLYNEQTSFDRGVGISSCRSGIFRTSRAQLIRINCRRNGASYTSRRLSQLVYVSVLFKMCIRSKEK